MIITLGKFKGRKIITQKYPNTRPTMGVVKESIFNIIDVEGKDVFDIFAGTGQLGFEAVSLGANKAVLVDKEKKVVHNMKLTVESLGIENIQIYNTDYRIALRKTKDTFDYIFVDPPYKNKEYYSTSFEAINKRKLLNKGGMVISEIDGKRMPASYYEKEFDLVKEKNYGNTTIIFLKGK
jgi:16S rRNA (guanine966-N2)-methyltransferase